LNRADLQQLAEDRILDADSLLAASQWSAAYYLAGYAVECALKSCIARRTKEFDFPDPDVARKVFTHDLASLLNLAGMKEQLQEDSDRIPPGPAGVLMVENWAAVKDWSERKRYEQTTEVAARDVLSAVTNPTVGVLPWIKRYW
jgi:hypothetical protein